MAIVLDTGALLAVERNDRTVFALLKRELSAGRVPVTHAGVVAQAWRGGGGRQAPLAKLLEAVKIEPLDDTLARRTGRLLGASRTADIVDAALVLIAQAGDEILTSDVDDLLPLAIAAAADIELIAV